MQTVRPSSINKSSCSIPGRGDPQGHYIVSSWLPPQLYQKLWAYSKAHNLSLSSALKQITETHPEFNDDSNTNPHQL